ncbi:hypothetical protein N0V88_005443 [Collariella sp. IMI 366227]|nr:hypothetical protein N0V88_005443 [Collariella sp. IMI 366227]
MTLTVLTDDQIRSLLENLTAAELDGFQGALAKALHEYSTCGADGETSVDQPERISVHNNATGATTLFMPSSNSSGNGIKELIILEKMANSKRAHLEEWLKTGNVIYKSVGLGLMDLSIGMHIVEFAKEKGVGTHVEGF